ncbi:MAG TPA: tetratricopeptide repeat protein, partial [Streptosporangiaceae bacterium]|nr:tetratricopeptide repeat protein [Streptosporangiaceae bacterium]
HHEALSYCQQALDLHREMGNARGEAATSHSLGHAHYQLGDYPRALANYQYTADLSVQLGDRYMEAIASTSLGDTYYATGDLTAARAAWLRGLEMYDQLRHTDAEAVRAKLRALESERDVARPGAVPTAS